MGGEFIVNWNHLSCEECWDRANPSRQPMRIVDPEPAPCCFCGTVTGSGIFVRHDPRTLSCEHPEEES